MHEYTCIYTSLRVDKLRVVSTFTSVRARVYVVSILTTVRVYMYEFSSACKYVNVCKGTCVQVVSVH